MGKPESFRKERAAVSKAKREIAEWVRVFGPRKTMGLVLCERRLVRAQVALCRAQSFAAVAEMVR